MKIKCKYLTLNEVPKLSDPSLYNEMVKPFDYEFSLIRNATYIVVGFLTTGGTLWLYIIHEKESDLTPQFVPSVLFDFEPQLIPSGWIFRLVGSTKEDIEIVPEELANLPNWYEHVIDEEEKAMLLIEKIFNAQKDL